MESASNFKFKRLPGSRQAGEQKLRVRGDRESKCKPREQNGPDGSKRGHQGAAATEGGRMTEVKRGQRQMEELGRIDVEREDERNKEGRMEVVNGGGRQVERGGELKKQENGVEGWTEVAIEV